MQLEDILTPERCCCRINGVSKKRILTTISEMLEEQIDAIEADTLFSALMAREDLGSTAVGNGIAIPHCKISTCPEMLGVLVTLAEPIDFDAIDGKPVDILFFLVVPQEKSDEHVKALATLAEMFSDPDFCYTLRHTHDSEDLYNVAVTF